jgi:hypothetical protein
VETKLVFRMTPSCAGDTAVADKPSAACAEFLEHNQRAREQWRLEAEFAKFEKNIERSK